jgi:hypothetical protein
MSVTQFPTVLSEIIPETKTRIRVNHSRTQRDGWGYETTVEIEYAGDEPGDEAAALARLGGLLIQARILAENERDARNERDGGRP